MDFCISILEAEGGPIPIIGTISIPIIVHIPIKIVKPYMYIRSISGIGVYTFFMYTHIRSECDVGTVIR